MIILLYSNRFCYSANNFVTVYTLELISMLKGWHGLTFPGEVCPSVVHRPEAYTKTRMLLAVTSTRMDML